MISPSVLDCFELRAGALTCRECQGADPWQLLVPPSEPHSLAELVYIAATHLGQGHYRVGES